MGKWGAFFVSLIPAGLAGYLCYLLVTIGLPAAEEMGTIFWGPVGAGFLACVMCLLTPIGIAIFVKSAPQAASRPMEEAPELSEEDAEFLSGGEIPVEDDLDDDDFTSDDDLDSADYQSAEIASDQFSDDEFETFTDDGFDDDDDFTDEDFLDDDDDNKR